MARQKRGGGCALSCTHALPPIDQDKGTEGVAVLKPDFKLRCLRPPYGVMVVLPGVDGVHGTPQGVRMGKAPSSSMAATSPTRCRCCMMRWGEALRK